MRADRLISLMLLLHVRGRTTAQELAEQLEVSERTIYRDLDALSIAGIPVYTQSGPKGGVHLDEHYRISLNGLSLKEAQGLFMVNDIAPLKELGLTNATMLLKLFAALPTPHRAEVERLRQRLHIDPLNWFQTVGTPSCLPILQQAVWEDRRIEVEYWPAEGRQGTRVLDAYALVFKANSWYLVATKSDIAQMHTYRITRFRAVVLTETRFERDDSFDLVEYWRAACAMFEQSAYEAPMPYEVTIRVHPDVFSYFPQRMEGTYEHLSTSDDGWQALHVYFVSPKDARMNLIKFGTQIEIVEPEELRHSIVEMAQEVIAHYSVQLVK